MDLLRHTVYLRDGSVEIKCLYLRMDLLRHAVYLRDGPVEIVCVSHGWIC